MRVESYTNSFFILRSNDCYLGLDPWISSCNCGGGHAYPIHEENLIIQKLNRCEFIYISHIHDDHFSPNLLKKLNLEKISFLIINYSNKHLKRALSKLGAKNIIEFEPWEIKDIGNFKISIIPQLQSNSSEIEDSLNYEMDTSIIIQDLKDDFLFYNNVDNPLPLNGLKNVADFCRNKFGRYPDLTALCCGAASEWPQCFLSIDRQKSKKEYINSCLEKLLNEIKILNPKYLLIAGGRYQLTGKFFPLNKYVAVPNLDQIFEVVKQNSNVIPIYISKGGFIETTCNSINYEETKENILSEKEIKYFSSLKYDYQLKQPSKYDEISTQDLMNKSRKNLLMSYEKISFKPECQVIFKTYQNLNVDKNGDFMPAKVLDSFELFSNSHLVDINKNIVLTVHLDNDALRHVLLGKCLLKQVMSGSMALQEREPDIFTPGTIFSLAYLKI